MNTQRYLTFAFFATLFCLSPLSASAAENEEFQLDAVSVSAARIADSILDTPAIVQQVSDTDIDQWHPQTAAQALQSTPGVTIQQYGGQSQAAIPYILGSNRIVVLIDGKRQNVPLNGSSGRSIDLNQYIMNGNIDHIEVVEGGAAVMYGSDAIGGVINIITKKGTENKTTLDLSFGNYASGNYQLTNSGSQDKSHWQVSLNRNNSDGQRPNSSNAANDVSLRWDQDFTDSQSLTLNYDYNYTSNELPGSITYPTPNNYQNSLTRNWSVAFNNNKADGSQQLWRYYANSQSSYGQAGGAFNLSNYVQGWQYHDGAALDKSNQINWGWEWLDENGQGSSIGNNSITRVSNAVYLQNTQQLNDSQQLVYGFRLNSSDQYGNYFLPQITFLNSFTENSSYFANICRIFNAPSFADLYGIDSYGNHGNPTLQAESGWTAETGWKTENTERAATYSLFYRRINDAIRWLPDDPNNSSSAWQPVNIDTLTTWGANLTYTYKLSNVTTVSSGYTYLNSQNQNSDPVGDPANCFNIGFNFIEDRWSNSINGVYTGSNGIAANTVGSYFVVNTSSNYQLDEHTSFYLTINNLFNTTYYPVYGFPANGITAMLGCKVSF